MDILLQDLRYGYRQLCAHKALSAAAILCIAIGVGANTTIFSAVNAVLLRPIPGVSDSDRLVEVGRAEGVDEPIDTLSYPTWDDVIEGTRGQLEIGLWTFTSMALSGDGEPEVVLGYSVNPAYFSVLRLQAARGRFFDADEGRVEDATPVAVISHGLWQRRYGGAGDVVGRRVRINGVEATIVGGFGSLPAGLDQRPHHRSWLRPGRRHYDDRRSLDRRPPARPAHFRGDAGNVARGGLVGELRAGSGAANVDAMVALRRA